MISLSPIDLPGDPTTNLHASSKQYIDNRFGSFRKISTQNLSSTSQIAIDGMSFSVVANGIYIFQMDFALGSVTGTSPTANMGFTGPASPVWVDIIWKHPTSTSVDVGKKVNAFTTTSLSAVFANAIFQINGRLEIGSTGGTVQLTSAVGGTTPVVPILAGSFGHWIRIG